MSAWWCEIPVAVVEGRGSDVRDLLQRLGTQDLRRLGERGGLPSLFVSHQGKLVASTRILAHGDAVWLVTDAHQGQTLQAWLQKYTVIEDATFTVLGEQWPLWRLLPAPPAMGAAPDPQQVEQALAALAPLGPVTLRPPSGWGEGFDLLIAQERLGPARAALQAQGLVPASAAESEFARLSVGEPAFGRDHGPLAPPLEWRLGHNSISWTKGCFVGQEVLSRLDNYNKVARLTMGVQGLTGARALAEAAAPEALRLLQNGVAIGKLASVAVRPGSEDAWVALALVKREAALEGPASLGAPGGAAPLCEVALLQRPFWGP